jgi:hypothetical protein
VVSGQFYGALIVLLGSDGSRQQARLYAAATMAISREAADAGAKEAANAEAMRLGWYGCQFAIHGTGPYAQIEEALAVAASEAEARADANPPGFSPPVVQTGMLFESDC